MLNKAAENPADACCTAASHGKKRKAPPGCSSEKEFCAAHKKELDFEEVDLKI